MESSYSLGTLLSAMKTDVRELINTKVELLKLEAFEKTSVVGSFLIYGVIIMNLIFFILLFAFVALSFWIGNLIDSIAGGFGLVTLFYVLILLILILCRKMALGGLRNLFLKELDPDLEDEVKYEAKHAYKVHYRNPFKENMYEFD